MSITRAFADARSKIFELAAGVQSYDWGAVGEDSVVAQYADGLPDFKIESDKPYAEARSVKSAAPSLIAAAMDGHASVEAFAPA